MFSNETLGRYVILTLVLSLSNKSYLQADTNPWELQITGNNEMQLYLLEARNDSVSL